MTVRTMKWGPWLPVVAAGAAAVYVYARRSSYRHGPSVAADLGSDTRQKLGGPAGVHVEEAVTVSRPLPEVFRFWRDLENLPRFMTHLRSVVEYPVGISHWVARGPAGMDLAWDARIINEVHDKLIAWQSLEGSAVSTAGSVNFRETPRGTEVRINLQYSPPGGKFGAAFAWLAGESPGTHIREDLRRFKQIIETGEIEIPRVERQPHGGGL